MWLTALIIYKRQKELTRYQADKMKEIQNSFENIKNELREEKHELVFILKIAENFINL